MLGSPDHQSVGVAMNRYSIGLMLLVMSSAPAFAQRGGRADALQNYLGQNRNPRLLLQIKYEKIRLYFRASDLQKKPRSIVKITDPATGLSHVYEGVSVEDLVPTGVLNHESGSLEVSSEHKQKTTILCRIVDFQTTPIVADKVDGKKLTGYVPYYFVVKSRQGGESTLRDVKQITVKASLD
jgi:hypothetical protein